MSLNQILRQEIDYWKSVKRSTSNRLIQRTADQNITKRLLQSYKLNKGIKV